MKSAFFKTNYVDFAKYLGTVSLGIASFISLYAVLFANIPVLNSLISFFYLFVISSSAFMSIIFIKRHKTKRIRFWLSMCAALVIGVLSHFIINGFYILITDSGSAWYGKRLLISELVSTLVVFLGFRYYYKKGEVQGQNSTNNMSIWKTGFPIKRRKKIQIIPFEDISHIKAEDKYVNVHTDNKNYLSAKTLTWLAENLPNEFIRVHRSYIVNISYVKEIRMNSTSKPAVYLSGEKIIPVGNTYVKRLKEMSKP